jgi:hypothetical protein
VKKGQDLSVPGTRDDLFPIFFNQRLRQVRRLINKQQQGR